MYNTGRMWRDRKDALTKADGDIAKALRNEFVVDHCRAVWLPLPDTVDIARLEAEVLSLAPVHAIAWNRRRMQAYDEPVDLVEATLRRLGWGAREKAAIERQRLRFLSAMVGPATAPPPKPAATRQTRVTPFPKGPFRFFALDVETANNDRGSICQIGVACVRPDNSIETWVTYVDPQVDRWVFTYLHGISARTVQGAPTFAEVLPVLRDALNGATVYQHSGFDRSAFAAACGNCRLPIPEWDWRDSVQVARVAWPELRGKGGHGLASLKQHLGLMFEHHDAGEDARAAAEVVLCAEGVRHVRIQPSAQTPRAVIADDEDFDLIEDDDNTVRVVHKPAAASMPSDPNPRRHTGRHIGTTEITQGNINHSHIYLRGFFEKFPADAIGGSNRASAAQREIVVDWGGATIVMTDLDGEKKFFRKRGWIREFFERHGVRAGDMVTVEEVAPYSYRVALQRRLS
jgi:DNA polymerase III epsilon subunit-like protein